MRFFVPSVGAHLDTVTKRFSPRWQGRVSTVSRLHPYGMQLLRCRGVFDSYLANIRPNDGGAATPPYPASVMLGK